jgi:dTDP-4-dehydrorhamnose reductase
VKIAVFGRSGQVATELQRRAPEGVFVEAIGRARADFTRPEEIVEIARSLDADAIINAVAYTAVDQAEVEPELAQSVNARSVVNLATVAAERGLPLLHISTDYVFDGSGDQPWKPADRPAPKSVYGETKVQGEALVTHAGGPHAILRTSWVFSAHGQNFVKTMLKLSETKTGLSIVADQIGGPTPAAAIADALFVIADKLLAGQGGGIYHFAGTPETSWAGFAREIFAQSGKAVEITEVTTEDFPRPAARPRNSRLDCSSLKTDFGIERPDWKSGLADVLEELKQHDQP